MSRKDQILALLQDCPNDVSFDYVIEKLSFLSRLEEGLSEIERNEVVDDDVVWQQFLGPSAKAS